MAAPRGIGDRLFAVQIARARRHAFLLALAVGCSCAALAQGRDAVVPREIGGDGPLSDRTVRRLFGAPEPEELRAGLARVGAALVAGGHLEAVVSLTYAAAPGDSGVAPEAAERTVAPARLVLEAGSVARWDTLRVQVRGGAEGPRPFRPQGEFVRARLEEQIREWMRLWGEAGYPFVAAEVESLTVRDGQVRAGIRLDPGPRVEVAETVFPGRRSVRADFLERWIRFRPGETFRDSDLERRQRKLERSELFSWVGEPRIEPIDRGRVRVHFPIEERLHNRVEGAVGYAGQSGTVSGRIDVEMGNLFGTGRALGVRWERLRAENSRLDLQYEEPTILGWPLGMKLQVHQQVEDTTFTLDRFEGGLFADLGTDLTVSLGYEVRRSILGTAPSDVVRRSSTVFGLEWQTLRPGRLRGRRVEGTFRTGRSRFEFADGSTRDEQLDRVEVAAESYWRRGLSWVARAAGRGGGLSGARDRPLPPSEALWIGGIDGPRGWDEEAFATRRYLVGQLELGVALAGERGRVYGFVDAAVYRSLVTGGNEDAGGWGVGVSSESTRRALVLDYGIPFGQGFQESRVHLRVRTRF